MYRVNFIDACINGDALYDEIDDYIDEWHDGDYTEDMYEFLGMTKIEYRLWVENDNILKYIIKAHMENKDIQDVLVSEYYGAQKLVARTKSPEEAKFIYNWLKKNGKIRE